MASINGEAAAAGNSINPLLLASARVGSWEALDFLLTQDPPMMRPTEDFLRLLKTAKEGNAQPPPRDIEVGIVHQPNSVRARALLEGITPDGDTVLHVVASNGDDDHFLAYANMICHKYWDLLFAKNHNGDTPLHCAARAGQFRMVSRLIDLAGPDRKLALLRLENKRHETALHEGVRIEDGRILGPKDREALFDADGAPEERIRAFVDQQEERTIVKMLMGVDKELAKYPADGISPLYQAILLEKSTIALTLYVKSDGNLSYSGADGQNALHVAVLRDTDTVMVELLLDWKKSLTTQVDKDGSTPLHFASASSKFFWSTGSFLRVERIRRPFEYAQSTLKKIFEANPTALYQADNNGFFPIHVAASVGALNAVKYFLWKNLNSAGLRDAKGKTFLHVAIEKRMLDTVSYACRNPALAWILNMQDNDRNTALHLAIQAGSFTMFCALFGNKQVNLSLTNNLGETPLDLSRSKLPRTLAYFQNSEEIIYKLLVSVKANHSSLRRDKAEEKYRRRPNPEEEDKESARLRDSTQTFIVASVLIATMAFTASSTIPGGNRADDHPNGGTPTLAGRYFDSFMMATTLSFVCSLLATTGFMLAGVPMVNLMTRRLYIVTSFFLMSSSITSMCIAFALGVYMVLAPVARSTAVAICVITALVFVCKEMESLIKLVIFARPLVVRKGLFLGTARLLRLIICNMAILFWPLVVIFFV